MNDDNEYARLSGERVQVLERFESRRSCAVCGGEPMDTDRRCPACGGDGREGKPLQFAKVGLLAGPDAGKSQVVLAATLGPDGG